MKNPVRTLLILLLSLVGPWAQAANVSASAILTDLNGKLSETESLITEIYTTRRVGDPTLTTRLEAKLNYLEDAIVLNKSSLDLIMQYSSAKRELELARADLHRSNRYAARFKAALQTGKRELAQKQGTLAYRYLRLLRERLEKGREKFSILSGGH